MIVPSRTDKPRLLLVLVTALTLALSLLPSAAWVPHGPLVPAAAEFASSTDLATPDPGHGHAHDEDDGSSPVHGHDGQGHDPTDHSHDTPGGLLVLAAAFPAPFHDWSCCPLALADPTRVFPMERPPRTIVAD